MTFIALNDRGTKLLINVSRITFLENTSSPGYPRTRINFDGEKNYVIVDMVFEDVVTQLRLLTTS